jgi:hypothetical protein
MISPSYARRTLRILAFVLALLLVSARDAFAYMDPGTGALLLQALLASLLGMAFYLRRFLSSFKDRFKGKKKDAQP